ncbi:MAG: hypothetical protein KJ042_12400, partial [Deltaproteobacteria bacterium]|nr:hypothetical protein [Deltaproteobacteria bacterium]
MKFRLVASLVVLMIVVAVSALAEAPIVQEALLAPGSGGIDTLAPFRQESPRANSPTIAATRKVLFDTSHYPYTDTGDPSTE